MKKYLLVLIALAATSFSPAKAEVEKLDDTTYKITGVFTYWKDLQLLAPAGRDNNFGEFTKIIFKNSAIADEKLVELKQTSITMKVIGRVAGQTLVVTEILDVEVQ